MRSQELLVPGVPHFLLFHGNRPANSGSSLSLLTQATEPVASWTPTWSVHSLTIVSHSRFCPPHFLSHSLSPFLSGPPPPEPWSARFSLRSLPRVGRCLGSVAVDTRHLVLGAFHLVSGPLTTADDR